MFIKTEDVYITYFSLVHVDDDEFSLSCMYMCMRACHTIARADIASRRKVRVELANNIAKHVLGTNLE